MGATSTVEHDNFMFFGYEAKVTICTKIREFLFQNRDQKCLVFEEGPVKPFEQKVYDVHQRCKGNEAVSKEKSYLVILLSVACVLIVVLTILLILFYLRRRRNRRKKNQINQILFMMRNKNFEQISIV
ncbi:hypothetical protein MHBO_000118 [Bonamia ostreae]|uniref:Uncharacterized protein n=1 Tax=Bonamia ostreae TaxID=126728 RepID=A0ABV2AFR9_9EUKA